MGTPPSRLGFLYSCCPTSSVGWGWALAGPEGPMSSGYTEARSLFAAVTEQAVVLVLCLSPASQSVDGEVVPTVPSLASAGSPCQPGGMLSPLCPSSLAVGRGRPSIQTEEAFSFFGFPLSLGSAFTFSRVALIVRHPSVAAQLLHVCVVFEVAGPRSVPQTWLLVSLLPGSLSKA